MRISDVVAHKLIDELKSGRFAVGDALPAEGELCKRFGVSRATVRSALVRLANLGLIRRQQGAPTRVLATEVTPIYVHSMSATGDLLDFSAPSMRRVQFIRPFIADEAFAPSLDNRPGRHWVHIGQTRHIDEAPSPTVWTDVYLAREYEDIAEDVRTYPGLVYTLLEQRHGVIINEINQTVDATTLTPEHAKLFDQEAGEAALRITRRYLDVQETCWLATISILPASLFSYQVTFRRKA